MPRRQTTTPKLAAIIADGTEEETAQSAGVSGVDAQATDHREHAALSDRETGVLRLVVQGLANKEIAARMGISASAVKNTMQQLFAKTAVRTRSQLVRVALEQYRNIL
jgi:DNA-binding NarL/FixJ family response regulator